MAANLETVVKQLEDSGIVAAGKLENFVPPKAHPKSVEELVAELVKNNHLTKFQAQHVAAGKAKSLILGNYTILDKIGAGGMGQVFKAEHRRLKRVVAIKMLPPAVTKDAMAVARFQREVEAAAKLRHPNIVATDDADQAGAVHFLVMEYIEGKDLSALVKNNGPLPVGKAVNFVLQAARGLEFAHGEGLVHRDIKPANLLLDKKGCVKILDMGLARIESTGNATTQAELTGTGTVMGTVNYMAPEQALHTKHADQRADIYSLGITLYYLLAGKAAYGGDSLMEKLLAHREQPIPSLQEVQTTIPAQLDAVFKKMVAKKVDDRYQTMSEVIEALTEVGIGGSVSGSKLEGASAATLTAEERKRLAKAGTAKSLSAVVTSEKSKHFLAKVIGGTFVTIVAPILVTFLVKYLEKDNSPAQAPVNTPTVTTAPAMTTTNAPGTTTQPVASPGGTNQPWETPAFQKWVADTQKLPAEEQIKVVSKQLKELNVLFDGKLGNPENTTGGPKIVDGVVREVAIDFAAVDDLSPLRGFSGIEYVKISGPKNQKQSPNLSPLSGMSLKTLHFSGDGGRWLQNLDISALQCPNLRLVRLEGMAFTAGGWGRFSKSLPPNCKYENISEDTSTPASAGPLKSWEAPEFQQWISDTQKLSTAKQLDEVSKKLMELNPGFDGKLKDFAGKGTPKVEGGQVVAVRFEGGPNISDLSPLRVFAGLKSLRCSTTRARGAIVDLSPLIGLTLTSLNIDKNDVSDLSPLKGMPLATFSCGSTNVNDLSVLTGMSLVEFACAGTQVSDLAPLSGMPLTTLAISKTNVTDLSPLRNCKNLSSLEISFIQIADLAPLSGLPLTVLNCEKATISTLAPLVGMPLKELVCSSTQIADLAPLKGMPLTKLWCTSTKVSSLEPLRGMPLTDLRIQELPVSDLSPLAGMPLQMIHAEKSAVTDIAALSECRSLRQLFIAGAKITSAQVAALQKALPNCKIEWDDPAKPKTPEPAASGTK